jgi:hypothetical protein
VKNPVSKFAFQVHNLQRYSAAIGIKDNLVRYACGIEVGRCTLNQVDP